MEEIKKIVLWGTGILASLIVIASVILFLCMTSIKIPPAPTLISSSTPTEQEAKTKEITSYKEIVSSLQSQRTNIYDYIVLKTLLPLFNSLIASVLTFIFAKAALQAFKIYMTEKYKKI